MTSNGWRSERLKNVADVSFSTVDKKNLDGELPVRLCNYTDVYYSDEIKADMNFMEATATTTEARSFGLRAGDLLITKDSETADDIGVPAFVPEVLDGVVCGYHLAMLRPKPELIDPKYLFWSISGGHVRQQMTSFASGVTRYGLRFGDVGNLQLSVPDTSRQRAVVHFLDRETARIDALLRRKLELHGLLDERLWSCVADVVCHGLEPSQRGDSGIPWIGTCPTHWTVTALRHLPVEVQTGPFGSQLHEDEYVEGGVPVINPANLADGRLVPNGSVTVTPDTANRLLRHQLRAGDVVFGRRGQLGRAAVVTDAEEGWLCGTGTLRVRFQTQTFVPGYLGEYLRLPAIRQFFESVAIGSTMDNLSSAVLLAMPFLVPPPGEQLEIATAALALRSRSLELAERLSRQIDLLAEHRQALITAAVTGQIDVGGRWTTPLRSS